MSKVIPLASGQITKADRITVALHQPTDTPAFVLVLWPVKATPIPPVLYAETAARVMKVLAAANVELAASRRRKVVDNEGDDEE